MSKWVPVPSRERPHAVAVVPRYAVPVRLTILAVTVLLVPAAALADARVMLLPGPGYRVEFKTAKARFTGFPRVERKGWFPIDRWFQVAPGGRSLAMWSKSTGLAVLSSDGADLLRRKDGVTAFRFSPNGDRLAFASGRGSRSCRWMGTRRACSRPSPGSTGCDGPTSGSSPGPALKLLSSTTPASSGRWRRCRPARSWRFPAAGWFSSTAAR